MIFQSFIPTAFEGNKSSMNILPYSLSTYCIAGGSAEFPLVISNTPMSDISNTPVTAPRNMKAPKIHIKESVYILGI